MSASDTSIVNVALTSLGEKAITSFDDDSMTARLALRDYAEQRDQLLQEHPWNFAIGRASMAANVIAPTWGFDHAYDLPADALRVVDVDNPNRLPWKVEGRQVITDITPPLNILYIKTIDDATLMTPQFRSALSARLAWRWAEKVTGSRSIEEQKAKEYVALLSMARSVDGQEGTTDPLEAFEWLDSRF